MSTAAGPDAAEHQPSTADPAPPADRVDGTAARLRAPLLTGAVGLAGVAAVAAWGPGDAGVPLCWSQAVLGVDCPLCGGLRCTAALARGDWAAAADHNVVLAVVLPVLAAAWVVWVVTAWRGRPLPHPRLPHPRAWAAAAVALLVAFTLARNSDATALLRWLGSGAA